MFSCSVTYVCKLSYVSCVRYKCKLLEIILEMKRNNNIHILAWMAEARNTSCQNDDKFFSETLREIDDHYSNSEHSDLEDISEIIPL